MHDKLLYLIFKVKFDLCPTNIIFHKYQFECQWVIVIFYFIYCVDYSVSQSAIQGTKFSAIL